MGALAEIVLLSPRAALVGLVFIVPLIALVVRERSARRARSTLGLTHPPVISVLRRVAVLVALAALVAATAAQPARRETSPTPERSDAEIYLTFDVSRSMLAATTPDGRARLERARALGRSVLESIGDVPTGVATLTNRMMPLLFPTGDGRSVSAVIDHSLRIMQPPPVPYTTARESSLSALGLAADRSYFDPTAKKRALVVFTDLDSDAFSLPGTLRILRRHRIEPFVVRVAAPGERVFDPSGRPYAYRSISTVTVPDLRNAGWAAFEEQEPAPLVAAIRDYLGTGPVARSGRFESQQNLASYAALAALALAGLLLLPALAAAIPGRASQPREDQATSG